MKAIKNISTIKLIFQGIVDADLKFIDVFAGWPVRTHDARVYHCSRIGQKILNEPWSVLPKSTHILGYGAYSFTEGFIVLYKDNGHLTKNQINFTKKLGSTRVLIEQAFGKLISRFRKLKYKLFIQILFCVQCTIH